MTNKTQLELQQEIANKAKIAVVTCGNCGTVLFHEFFDDEVKCPDCDFQSEPCDFPDLYY